METYRKIKFSENLGAWDRYEKTRDNLTMKLNSADEEFLATHKIFDLTTAGSDYSKRLEQAKNMRNDIENTFLTLSNTTEILSLFTGETKKSQMSDEVSKNGQLST